MITIKSVTTLREAFYLRNIRNECREFFTRDQSKIGFFEQILWWFRNRGKVEAFLVYREMQGWSVPIAFGVINDNEVTGGVKEVWRGDGIGRLIFSLMTKAVPKPAELEVLADNLRAINLYEGLGWEVKWCDCGLVPYRHGHYFSNKYGHQVTSMKHYG